MAGYVKLFRSIESWEWYTDVNTSKLFLHCLIKANHKPAKWRGIVIEAGSFVTSVGKLSKETGLSVRSIRTSLERLKSTSELTSKTTNRFTQIFVVKWRDYQSQEELEDKQSDTQNGNRVTSERQTNDKQTTTNKNDKNEKNKKNEENKENTYDAEAREGTEARYSGLSIEEAFRQIALKPFTEPLTEEEVRIIRLHDGLRREGFKRIG